MTDMERIGSGVKTDVEADLFLAQHHVEVFFKNGLRDKSALFKGIKYVLGHFVYAPYAFIASSKTEASMFMPFSILSKGELEKLSLMVFL